MKLPIIPRIIVDKRELHSPVSKELELLGVEMEFDTISVGDYVMSKDVAGERKTIDDFLSSWLDENKIWSQLRDLAHAYPKPFLIIEGNPDELYTARMVHANAVRGILRSIAVSMRLPIIYSLDAQDTALWLYNIAVNEQDTEKKRSFSWHGKRSHMTLTEQQEYIVSAVQDVGPTAAKNLLNHFGSIQAVFTASIEELVEVENIGKKTAEKIIKVIGGKYVRDVKTSQEKKTSYQAPIT